MTTSNPNPFYSSETELNSEISSWKKHLCITWCQKDLGGAYLLRKNRRPDTLQRDLEFDNFKLRCLNVGSSNASPGCWTVCFFGVIIRAFWKRKSIVHTSIVHGTDHHFTLRRRTWAWSPGLPWFSHLGPSPAHGVTEFPWYIPNAGIFVHELGSITGGSKPPFSWPKEFATRKT